MHAPGGRTAVTRDELFDEFQMALDSDTRLNEMIVTHLVAHCYS